jgi:hypothetical protein
MQGCGQWYALGMRGTWGKMVGETSLRFFLVLYSSSNMVQHGGVALETVCLLRGVAVVTLQVGLASGVVEARDGSRGYAAEGTSRVDYAFSYGCGGCWRFSKGPFAHVM